MPIVDGHLVINGHVYGGGDGSSKENAIEITTFRELTEADEDILRTSGTINGRYYLKIVEDLNPSKEDWFTGFVTKTVWYSYIFCDENDRKKINGLIISGNCFLNSTTYAQTNEYRVFFENIDFTNCVIYPTNSTVYLFGDSYGNNTYCLNLINTTVSIRVAYYSGLNLYVCNQNCIINGCSMNIIGSNKSAYIHIDTGKIRLTNIVMDSFIIQTIYPTYTTFWKQCSFIFKNCQVTGSVYGGVNISVLPNGSTVNTDSVWTPVQSYIALSNCTYDMAPYKTDFFQPFVLATDTTPFPFTHNSAGDQVIYATLVDSTDPNFDTSSLKSKTFLINSGFLP